MAARNVIEIVVQATDEATKPLEKVTVTISDRFKEMGKNLAISGAGLGLAVAPVAAVFADAVNEASAFQYQMSNIQAILGATPGQMEDITAKILDFGAKSVAGPEAVAAAFEEIAGGVADSSTHMAILEASIKTAEAGQADLAGTTAALVAVMNSYQYSADKASMVSDVLTQTVGMGVGSMEEFAGAMPQVTGLAASLGVSFTDVGSAMAFLTTKGFTASTSANQLKAMMVSMLNPNEKMRQALNDIGYASGSAAIEQLGLVGAFQALNSQSPTFQGNMAGAVGSVEALNGVIALTDDSFNQFNEDFVEGVEGATDAARKVQLDNFKSQMDLLKSSVAALRIEIGMALLPILTRLVSVIQPAIQAIVEFAREHQRAIQAVGTFVGILAAVASGAVLVGGAMALVGLALANLPLLAVAAGATGLITLFDDLSNKLSRFVFVVRAMWDALKAGRIDAFSALKGLFDLFLGDLAGNIESKLSALPNLPKLIFEKISGAFAGANAETGAEAGMLSGVVAAWLNSGIATGVQQVASSALDLAAPAQSLATKVQTGLKAGFEAAAADFTWIATWLTSHISDALSSLPTDMFSLGTQATTIANSLSTNLATGIQGTDINATLQPVGDFIAEHLFDVIKVALTLFTGGVAGLAVAAVVTAFESDFLGFRSALESSGVMDSVKEGVSVITDTLTGLLSGEGGGGMDFSTLVSSITGSLQPLVDFVGTAVTPVKDGLLDLKDGIVGFIDAFKGTETGNIQKALGKIIEAIGSIVAIATLVAGEAIGAALTGLGEFLPKLGAGISDLITALDKLLGGDYAGALDSLKSGVSNLLSAFVEGNLSMMQTFIDGLLGLAGIDLESIKTSAAGIGTSIKQGIADAFLDMVTFANDKILVPLINGIVAMVQSVVGTGMVIANKLKEGIGNAFSSIADWVNANIISPISNAIMGAVQALIDAGYELGKGIVDGLKNAIESLLPSIDIGGMIEGTIVGDAWNAIKGHSPSKVFEDIGKSVVEGFALGVAPLQSTLNGLTPPSTSGLAPAAVGAGGMMGGGGVTINLYGDINGVQNARQFWDELETEARLRNRVLAPRR